MKQDPWNPFWQAIDHLRENIPEDEREFDPIAFGGPEIIESVAKIALRVQEREKVKSGDEYGIIKAAYLLGLAAGLKYAPVTEATLDKLIEGYNRLFPRFGSDAK